MVHSQYSHTVTPTDHYIGTKHFIFRKTHQNMQHTRNFYTIICEQFNNWQHYWSEQQLTVAGEIWSASAASLGQTKGWENSRWGNPCKTDWCEMFPLWKRSTVSARRRSRIPLFSRSPDMSWQKKITKTSSQSHQPVKQRCNMFSQEQTSAWMSLIYSFQPCRLASLHCYVPGIPKFTFTFSQKWKIFTSCDLELWLINLT